MLISIRLRVVFRVLFWFKVQQNNKMSSVSAKTNDFGTPQSSSSSNPNAWKEGAFGLLCGLVYGATSPIVGHPLDTIKTKQQAQQGYMGKNVWQCLTSVVKQDGPLGLYRGLSGYFVDTICLIVLCCY